tara:strand:- start:1622 stop:4087 length:2466 start_codon:yes stop_codon:yes gene_type:complete
MIKVISFFGIFLLSTTIIAQTGKWEGDFESLEKMKHVFDELNPAEIQTGILIDKILLPPTTNSMLETEEGVKKSSTRIFKNVYSELQQSTLNSETTYMPYTDLDAFYNPHINTIPINLLLFSFNKIKDDAFVNGLLEVNGDFFVHTSEEPVYDIKTIFLAAPVREKIYGVNTTYKFQDISFLSNLDKNRINSIEVDFDDGQGFRQIGIEESISISYEGLGVKQIKVNLYYDEELFYSHFEVEIVEATPAYSIISNIESGNRATPDDSYTFSTIYEGRTIRGTGYLFKSPATSTVKNPIIIPEGFDVDENIGVNELYTFFNGIPTSNPDVFHRTAECLLAKGFDIIFLDFEYSKDYIQANAALLSAFIQFINTNVKDGNNGNIVIGPSMGGLVSRYALRKMELNNQDHETELFISFDTPHQGANIPVGDQAFFWFFAWAGGNSAAADIFDKITSPAANQMLVHQLRDGSITNPKHTEFYDELKALGYPETCKNVAVANGAGNGGGLLFTAGDQIIKYEYNSTSVDIRGNVWSVPDQVSNWKVVFHGLIDAIYPLPDNSLLYSVQNTLPFDNCPGGFRATQKSMAGPASKGTVYSLHDNHSFVSTISALDINTNDLFYNISANSNILNMTPFDAIYYSENTSNDPNIVVNKNELHTLVSTDLKNILTQEVIMKDLILDNTTRNMGEKRASNSIVLMPGFQTTSGEMFSAEIVNNQSCKNIGYGNKRDVFEDETSVKFLFNGLNQSESLIYPNPVVNTLKIRSSENNLTSIKIYNLMGQLVKTVTVNVSLETYKVDVSNLITGVYLCSLEYSNIVLTEPIIIQR